MKPTDLQLQYLRSHPHRTNLYLSIYSPRTITTARVATGTYSTGETDIDFYFVSGSYVSMYANQTVLIGSQPGVDDYGRIRVRSFASGTMVVAENAINWKTGQYLTFIDQIDIQAIYPKIIKDPNNATNVIFYKDGDIPYTNQNTVYGTFPCAGPHRAAFLDGGTATLYYTATGTYNVRGDAVTYSWLFEGGTPTGSTSLTPGNVTYSTPGHYKTKLTTTSASGVSDVTYRYVSIYNRPNQGTFTPVLKWEMSELSGSRNEGGYTASFKVYDNIGEIQPNALVVIFADTWYGGTKANVGGNAQNSPSIVFVGYILKDTISFNWRDSSVEFAVGSISEVMKMAEGFSVSCESKANPDTWFELQEMTVLKAIYHYLRWHSTVLNVTDFAYVGDDRLVQYFDSDRGSLYDAVDTLLRDGMLGALISDRQGRLWGEINSYGLENPFNSIPHNFTLHKQDWIGEPQIEERRVSEVSFVELGGIAYYGVSTNKFSALISNAPSTTPLYFGKSEKNEGLILTSQSQLNQLAGNYLAHSNTRFPSVNMPLAGTYLNFDIVPQERLYLVVDNSDTARGKSIQDLPYIVESMEWSYDARNESFVPNMALLQIATGTMGQTVLIPATPPDSGYNYPDIELPPLPEFPGSPPVGPTTPMTVLFHDNNIGFVYTTNFDSTTPSYLMMNGGLTEWQYQNANSMFVTPNGAVYVAKIDGSTDVNRLFFVARAPALGQPFTILYNNDNVRTGPGRAGIFAMGFNPASLEEVALIMEGNSEGKKIYIGNGTTFAAGTTVSTSFWNGTLSFGLNVWLWTEYARWATVQKDGSAIVDTSSSTNIDLQHFRGSSELGKVIARTNDGVHKWWFVSDDNFKTTDLIEDNDLRVEGLSNAISADGLLMMARYNNGGARGKSSDGGYSWAPIPNLPYVTDWVWCYAGGSVAESKWIAGFSYIMYSPDFGNTWVDKRGNYDSLSYFSPSVNMIFVPGVSQSTSNTNYN